MLAMQGYFISKLLTAKEEAGYNPIAAAVAAVVTEEAVC
jgi:hypothetical protein